MSFRYDRVHVWSCEVPDEPGGVASKLAALAQAGENLEYVGTRRLAEKPGWGVLYIAPDQSDMRELDDLNADFVAFRDASIDVKVMPLSDLMPPAQQTPQSHGYYYGGHAHTHFLFWQTYGWYSSAPGRPALTQRTASPLPQVSRGAEYRPAPRPTIFSSRTLGGGAGIGKQKPSGFGRVSVRTSRSTGSITAVRTGRSGSFGRAGSSGSS